MSWKEKLERKLQVGDTVQITSVIPGVNGKTGIVTEINENSIYLYRVMLDDRPGGINLGYYKHEVFKI